MWITAQRLAPDLRVSGLPASPTLVPGGLTLFTRSLHHCWRPASGPQHGPSPRSSARTSPLQGICRPPRGDTGSNSSIRGDHPPGKGNKLLKQALLLFAFAAPDGPNIEGLIRPKTSRRKTPESGTDSSRPPPLRRCPPHAQSRNPPRSTNALSLLTNENHRGTPRTSHLTPHGIPHHVRSPAGTAA